MATRQFVTLALVCVCATFAGGMAMQYLLPGPATAWAQQSTIRAERFELVESDGTLRGFLEVAENGLAGLTLQNAAGERIILALHRDGREVLRFLGPNNKARAVMRAHRDGLASVTLLTDNHQSVALMALYEDGESMFALRDKNGKVVWSRDTR